MATFQRRKDNSIRVQIRRKGHAPLSQTFEPNQMTLARAWAAKQESDLALRRHGGIPDHTVREAVDKYIEEECPKLKGRSKVSTPTRLRWILKQIDFADRNLASVTRADLSAMVAHSRTRMVRGKPIASATVRRDFGMLRTVFSKCVNPWEWLANSPYVGFKGPADGKPRKQRVSEDDTEKMLAALGYTRGERPETAGQFLAVMLLLAIETTMRKGELLALTHENVDGELLHVIDPKNGEDRVTPLGATARELIALLPQRGPLFPIGYNHATKLWIRARKEAGLSGHVNFHDARREGTSRLAALLKDPFMVSQITGHKDLATLKKHYFQPGDLRALAVALP